MLAQERLESGRIHHCMRWIGICERVFDLMCHYAATRTLAPSEFLGHDGPDEVHKAVLARSILKKYDLV